MLNALEVGTHAPIPIYLNISETVICLEEYLDRIFDEVIQLLQDGE